MKLRRAVESCLRRLAAGRREWLFPFALLVLTGATSAHLGSLYWAAKKQVSATFSVRPLLGYYLVLRLQQLCFGVALGLGHVLAERAKPGRWGWSVPRLVAAVPAAFVSLAVLAVYVPVLWQHPWVNWLFRPPFWNEGGFDSLMTILFGYLVATALRKRERPPNPADDCARRPPSGQAPGR